MNGITKFSSVSVEKMQRLKTGIEGLDKLIEGGIPKNSITLI